MKSFKTKKPEFDAVQWTGNNDEEISAFLDLKDIAAGIKLNDQQTLVINYYAGVLKAPIGSWLGVYEGGHLVVYNDSFLWANYEEATV